MLMAHPVVLKNLLEQYETLSALHAEKGTKEARQRMEDVAYTLCVSTGTRHIDAALTAARHQLSAPRVDGGHALTA
ncbi:DUF5133 domain-containing protein [Streptomyces longisporoflavus]|uniref:DUF5133 domain-containing protein n=1 Tax=Streptomyces longisporoflavus TaxID=28044 RepID=UPI00167DBA64|nr:DUF5133 domain-containing protein [Streptomyces longisporoflavus]GGV70165.1 DUF5133 domain-containing protein [Streptomyces longisporoflavus]